MVFWETASKYDDCVFHDGQFLQEYSQCRVILIQHQQVATFTDKKINQWLKE